MKRAMQAAMRPTRSWSNHTSQQRFISTSGEQRWQSRSLANITSTARGKGLSRSRAPLISATRSPNCLQWNGNGGRPVATIWRRYNSSETSNLTSPARPLPENGRTEPVDRQVPSYDLTFTCKPCQTRSTHRISKQGYHKGTVLITCPQCQNRHLIADHLNIFGPDMTIDQFLEEQGEAVQRGVIGPGGDIEIWNRDTDDPTQGQHVGAPYDEGEEPGSKNGSKKI